MAGRQVRLSVRVVLIQCLNTNNFTARGRAPPDGQDDFSSRGSGSLSLVSLQRMTTSVEDLPSVQLLSVNSIVPAEDVLTTALQWARTITANSPDAVQSTKRGIVASLELGGMEDARLSHVLSGETERLFRGDNVLVSLVAIGGKGKF